MKEAARMTSLPALLDSGNIYRLPEELAREAMKLPESPAVETPQEVQ